MKTQEETGATYNSPGVKISSEQDNLGNGENGQSDSQISVENDDSDNWFNESAI